MVAKLPAIHLYPGDWLRDSVAGCSLAAQGLWLRMMFVAHDSERYGYLSQNGSPIPPESIARRCGCTPDQYLSLLAELDAAAVPSRSDDQSIFSRRMVRDEQERKNSVKNGRKGGNPQLKTQVNPPDKPSLKMKMKLKMNEFPENLRTERFLDAWCDWIVYRREIHHPLKPTMESRQLTEFAKIGEARAIGAIEHTIFKGWQGLREPDGAGTARNGAPHGIRKPDPHASPTGSHAPIKIREFGIETNG